MHLEAFSPQHELVSMTGFGGRRRQCNIAGAGMLRLYLCFLLFPGVVNKNGCMYGSNPNTIYIYSYIYYFIGRHFDQRKDGRYL